MAANGAGARQLTHSSLALNHPIFSIALAPDARRVYVTSAVNEADIWMMRFEESPGR